MEPASLDPLPIGRSPSASICRTNPTFAGFFDLPICQQVMQPLPDLTAVNPLWAGSTAGYNGNLQNYMNADQVAAPPGTADGW